MDVSSGAAVAALFSSGRNTDVRVLDLCCSPGLKLCMMADLLSSSSTIVGVDISERRLALCKSIVKKYHVDSGTLGCPRDSNRVRIRLYCADGTRFGTEPDPQLIFDSVAATEEQKTAGKRKRMNKSARARERKRLRQLSSVGIQSSTIESEIPASQSSPLTIYLFDLVLVDAECSTDGSLKHVQQRVLKRSDLTAESGGNTTASNPTLTDPEKLKSLVELQNGLIASGFNLLKPDGVLVYSTCSLSIEQNEGVVKWLLENHKDSFVIPVKFPLAEGSRIREGTLEGTVRFLPSLATTEVTDSGASLYGGGFFLAKIGKRAVGA
jgi:16S rRNA C967 or C1407 C5-methylase (RsmB/RsmF family)